MAQYSYPLLQSDEILTVLRELTIDATSDAVSYTHLTLPTKA